MISLYDILDSADGQLFGEPSAQLFTGFCFDSTEAQEAQLYVAFKTDRGDTHQGMREAIDNGALGILCTRPPQFDTDGITVIVVKDTEKALMAWGHFLLGKLGTKVIGVTGSTGKSLAVHAIQHVLASKFMVSGSDDRYTGRMGLPYTLANLTPEHQMVVVELSTAQPGELAQMVQAVRPETGVITQISHAHIDYFDDLEHIAEEKAILIDYLSPSGLAVLNFDNDYVREMANRSKAPVTTIGLDRFGADLMAFNIVPDLIKTGFDLRYGAERMLGRWTPLLGKHQLYAALFGLAVGLHYGIELEEGLRALTTLKPLPGRLSPFTGINGHTIIDDTHVATPDSAIAALDWLQTVSEEENHRTIFVIGDVDNLGDYSHRGHRIIGQRAGEVADYIITQGTQASLVGRSAIDQGMDSARVEATYSVQDTVSVLRAHDLTEDDVVIVKGGESGRMELVVQALLADEDDRAQLSRRHLAEDTSALFLPTQNSWLEINREALAGNVRAIKELIGQDVSLMAVVKADGYGHGAVAVAKTAILNGANYLGVSALHEGAALRDAGISAPILVLGYTPAYLARQAVRHDLALTLYDLDLARAYNQAAAEIEGKLRIHVKIDTGMGRLGILPEDAIIFFRHLLNLKNLVYEGVYTHFSVADEDEGYTEEQADTFSGVVGPLRASGIRFEYVHAANSAGTLRSADYHFDMVRVGMAMYGIPPHPDMPLPEGYRAVMTWKTVVAQIKTLPSGHPVGYGNTYRVRREEKIAIIPVGYANGFRRAPNTWPHVLIQGQKAPLVGRVSMEKAAVNVTKIEHVAVGDEVVLLGKQGAETLTAQEIAESAATNAYEIITTILARMPRR